MKLLHTFAWLVGSAALAFTALSPVTAADKKLTILFAVPGLDFPFFVHMADAIKAEASKTGNIEMIVSDGQRSSTKETADVEAAITKGVDGIVISPNDVDALAAAIQEAVDAKIPIVTVNRRVNKVPGKVHMQSIRCPHQSGPAPSLRGAHHLSMEIPYRAGMGGFRQFVMPDD